MTDTNEMEELQKEIRKTIEENRKFLDRMMDDDFEPEEGEEEDEEIVEELRCPAARKPPMPHAAPGPQRQSPRRMTFGGFVVAADVEIQTLSASSPRDRYCRGRRRSVRLRRRPGGIRCSWSS